MLVLLLVLICIAYAYLIINVLGLFELRCNRFLFVAPVNLRSAKLSINKYDDDDDEHLGFLFLVFFISLFVAVPCGRLS